MQLPPKLSSGAHMVFLGTPRVKENVFTSRGFHSVFLQQPLLSPMANSAKFCNNKKIKIRTEKKSSQIKKQGQKGAIGFSNEGVTGYLSGAVFRGGNGM